MPHRSKVSSRSREHRVEELVPGRIVIWDHLIREGRDRKRSRKKAKDGSHAVLGLDARASEWEAECGVTDRSATCPVWGQPPVAWAAIWRRLHRALKYLSDDPKRQRAESWEPYMTSVRLVYDIIGSLHLESDRAVPLDNGKQAWCWNGPPSACATMKLRRLNIVNHLRLVRPAARQPIESRQVLVFEWHAAAPDNNVGHPRAPARGSPPSDKSGSSMR
jgi:hypothetical protein